MHTKAIECKVLEIRTNLTTGIIGFKISDELLYVVITKIIEYNIQENYMNLYSINERI